MSIIHAIYENDRSLGFLQNLRAELYSYSSVNHNTIAPTIYGPMIVNRYDRAIGRANIEQGRFDPEQTDLLKDVLTVLGSEWKRTVIVDVGANLGSFARDFARFPLANVEVHSFEAQYQIFLLLAGNVAINNLDNVFVYHNAVSDRTGMKITFPAECYNENRHFGGVSLVKSLESNDLAGEGVAAEGKQETVSTVCLDDLDLSDVRLIKIDVEGMEDRVLIGASKTIARCRPLLFVEVSVVGVDAVKKVLDKFEYRYYWATGIDILAMPKEIDWTPDMTPIQDQ